jgi:transglutaminase-like putative cysteine protease
MPAELEPTWFIDSDSAEVAAFVESVLEEAGVDRDDPRAVAVALFLAVRDRLRYDPYAVSDNPDDFRASNIISAPTGWCVPKAVLYTATLRHVGIPARLAFADVRNHLSSEKLSAAMGTDVFAWHGYTEVLLDGRWLKASTAFNKELCERFGVKVLDFDGTTDALLHPFDEAGNRHMEYIRSRGSYDDLPLEEIFATFAEVYSPDMFEAHLAGGDPDEGHPDADFAP